MIDWNHYRKLFPVTKKYVYLQTAGAGSIPTPVLNSIIDSYTRLSQEGGNIFQKNIETMERCRVKLAKLINAEPEEIAFIPNVSFGMNALAHSFDNTHEFVVSDEEFPSSLIPWQKLKYPLIYMSPSFDYESNRKSIITSIVQYATGHKIDLNYISQHKKPESYLILNATQAIGTTLIDVKEMKVDSLVCAAHKWLFCGEGISFIYISNDFFKKLNPAVIGWRSSSNAMNFSGDFEIYNSAKAFEIGWPNATIFTGLEKAIDLVFEIGMHNIVSRVSSLMNYLINELRKASIPILSDYSKNKDSGILLLGPFEQLNDKLQALQDRNILVTKRGDGIRVALHFYNNENDINVLLSSLKEII